MARQKNIAGARLPKDAGSTIVESQGCRFESCRVLIKCQSRFKDDLRRRKSLEKQKVLAKV